jgi:hypothetical protein
MGAASIQRNAYLRNQNWQLCDEKCVRTRPPFVFFFPIRPLCDDAPRIHTTPPRLDHCSATYTPIGFNLTNPPAHAEIGATCRRAQLSVNYVTGSMFRICC